MKWHAKEGDNVKADSTIVEVETDKAVVELPSPSTGTVLKINFKEGEVVKVGQTLVVIGEAGEKVEAKAAPVEEKPAGKPAEPGKPPVSETEPKPTGRVLATPATRRKNLISPAGMN